MVKIICLNFDEIGMVLHPYVTTIRYGSFEDMVAIDKCIVMTNKPKIYVIIDKYITHVAISETDLFKDDNPILLYSKVITPNNVTMCRYLDGYNAFIERYASGEDTTEVIPMYQKIMGEIELVHFLSDTHMYSGLANLFVTNKNIDLNTVLSDVSMDSIAQLELTGVVIEPKNKIVTSIQHNNVFKKYLSTIKQYRIMNKQCPTTPAVSSYVFDILNILHTLPISKLVCIYYPCSKHIKVAYADLFTAYDVPVFLEQVQNIADILSDTSINADEVEVCFEFETLTMECTTKGKRHNLININPVMDLINPNLALV